MGLGDEQLVNPRSVSESLRCAICTDVYEDPVFCGGTPCQHIFCRPCLEPALRQKKRCPLCKAAMQAKHIKNHLLVRSLLDELLVRCPSGCDWVGRYDARKGHIEVCPVKQLEVLKVQVARKSMACSMVLRQRDTEIETLRSLLRQAVDGAANFRLRCAQLTDEVAAKDIEISKLRALLVDAVESFATFLKRGCTDEAKIAKRARCQRSMQVFVKDFRNKSWTFKVDAETTVSELKEEIMAKTSVPPTIFYLTCSGKELVEDHRLVDCCDLKDHSTVWMVGRLKSAAAPVGEPGAASQPASLPAFQPASQPDQAEDEDEDSEDEDEDSEDEDEDSPSSIA